MDKNLITCLRQAGSKFRKGLQYAGLATVASLFCGLAAAEHGPGISETAKTSHTQSVMRTTSGENITISLQSSGRNAANAATSGETAEQAALLKIYRSNLLKKTYQHVVYPESAIEKNQEGEVVLAVTVDRNGKVRAIDYDSRARFNSLNKAASIAVKRAKPYPPVPNRLQGETFQISMPIRFRLQG